jgi:hypothetical protein
MTRRISKIGVFVAIGVLAAGTAFANPIEMEITSGGTSYASLSQNGDFVWNNMGNIIQPAATVTGSGSLAINGWTITTAKGTSESPSLSGSNGNFALDLDGLAASCGSATCGALDIWISDTGFTTPVGPNGLATTIGGSLNGSGTLTQWAYMDAYTGLPTSTDYFNTNTLIGMVSSSQSDLSGPNSYAMGGVAAGGSMGAYSLTLADQFTGSDGATFSVDDQIVATPEPGAFAIFAAGLLGCALFVSRRRRARQSGSIQ